MAERAGSSMTQALAPLSAPTFYFIGVTTAQSSIMRIFPQWMDILGLDAQIAGYDAPLHAPPEVYRAIVAHIKSDPLARGGLVTTHKIDLLNAARDLFDELDSYAQLCDEVSAIGKRGGGLFGAAVDVLSSRLTWQTFVPAGHWASTGGYVLCLGAGGAAVAISLCAAAMPDGDRPQRFIVVDVNESRLAHIR
ncbi:MAG: shikimate dehydrogenase, partial [Burkholderiales bacterium]|nr:shikimate dehydrogenase [Anaerolineae bacterium]